MKAKSSVCRHLHVGKGSNGDQPESRAPSPPDLVSAGLSAASTSQMAKALPSSIKKFELLHCREELEFLANTLIFVLSGVIITGKIWESSTTKIEFIQPEDYGYAVLLWVYLVVSKLRYGMTREVFDPVACIAD